MYLLRSIIRFLLFAFPFCCSFCSCSLCFFCLTLLVFLLLFPLYRFSGFFTFHRQIGLALVVDDVDVQLPLPGKDSGRKLKPFTNAVFFTKASRRPGLSIGIKRSYSRGCWGRGASDLGRFGKVRSRIGRREAQKRAGYPWGVLKLERKELRET